MVKPRLPGFVRRSWRPGVLLLEAALGTGLLVLFLGALGVTVYRGQETTKAGGDRIRATKLAQQAIEGARDIGARNFNNGAGSLTSVIGQTKGVVLNAQGLWEFSGSTTTEGNFVTSLAVSQPNASDPNTLDLTATTTWRSPQVRPQTVSIKSRFTNWRLPKNVGDWGSSLQLLGQFATGSTEGFNDVAVVGTLAYVTNANTNRVVVVDLSTLDTNPGAPLTSPNSIDLQGQTPVAIASRGTTLYVVTRDGAGAHIRVYDAKLTPQNPAFVVQQDVVLAGGMLPSAITISGDFLYFGAR